jgi:hypothetical protein
MTFLEEYGDAVPEAVLLPYTAAALLCSPPSLPTWGRFDGLQCFIINPIVIFQLLLQDIAVVPCTFSLEGIVRKYTERQRART